MPTGAAAEIDTATNTLLRTIEGVTDDIGHLAVSRDGLCLYAGLSRGRNMMAVRPTILVEGKAGEAVGFGKALGGRGGGLSGVVVLPGPDGTRLLVFQHYEGIVALDPATLAVKTRYKYREWGDITNVAPSPDGRHLYLSVVGEEGRIVDAETLAETGTFPAGGYGMCVGSDGTLCVAEDGVGVLLRPGTDPLERREIGLPAHPMVAVQAAPTTWRP
ncbi:YncE family protein [Streptomyces sp. NPDC001568]|uniref:YncE family protein n=1 Tax=Streptomyces sp. NPDC001568 TaxID=3364588 RepID=UPI0036B5A6EB